MQRNLRPPVFTSMNRIGLLHLEHVGGEVFFAKGALTGWAEAQNTLSHR
jgi:hypothetical protein